jgi:5-methylcytosine-specific restriction endonuclease McrA
MKQDGTPHKVPSVQFQCNPCQSWVSRKDINVDHIDPVIPIDGTFEDWQVFVDRLFCDKGNLQLICSSCHHTKTQEERKKRRECVT